MIIEPDPVCGSGGSSVWPYMAAVPHLSLIECKLNLVLSLGGKTDMGGGGGRQSIWKQYLQKKITPGERRGRVLPGGTSARRDTASVEK